MQIEKLDGTDVTCIERSFFSDSRGSFTRIFCEETFSDAGLPTRFPHMNFSENVSEYTLRGMHVQLPPHQEGKLVFCVSGRVFDVAVDVRPESPSFGSWVGKELSAGLKNSLYIPPGFAHGFLTMEPNSSVVYLATEPYNAQAERGMRFDDPAVKIEWPAPPKVISEKDNSWPDFNRGQFINT